MRNDQTILHLLVATALVAACGDDEAAKGGDGGLKPEGAFCQASAECDGGICHEADGYRRCHLRCATPGEPCPSGGTCFSVPGTEVAACPNLFCREASDCGLNAVCAGEADSEVCTCLPDFFGDARASCTPCAPENERPGCVRNETFQPEVLGECLVLADGSPAGRVCTARADCEEDQGCFGYQPALPPDPPCACTDLRGLDLSGADSLDDLTGAWYDGTTAFPEDVEAETSGALGPGAQLEGEDLSGVAPEAKNDLRGVDLGTANVSEGDLSNTDLSDANLSGADLSGADLSGADLSGADLSDADLSDADLSGADLSGANLKGADLSGANLEGANLDGANLSGANLDGVSLDGTEGLEGDGLPEWLQAGIAGCEDIEVEDCKDGQYYAEKLLQAVKDGLIDAASGALEGADLSGVDLRGLLNDLGESLFGEASLKGANLAGANLSGVDLSGTDLSFCDLTGADLSGAKLAGANLTGAIMRDCDLTGAQGPGWICAPTGAPCYDDGAGCPGGAGSCVDVPESAVRLVGVDLSGAILDGADFRNADLTDAVMVGTSFRDARLDGATMLGTGDPIIRGPAGAATDGVPPEEGEEGEGEGEVAEGGVASGGGEHGVNMTGADLTGCSMTGVELNAAVMAEVQMGEGTDCTGAKMAGVELSGARLGGASFRDAVLTGATMRRVVADARTLFDGAQMKPVDLTDACLNNVRMVDLKLSSSILLRTSLVGADLQHTEFEASDMRGVRFGDFETNCVCDIPGGPTRCQMTLVRGTNFKDADLSPADGRPSDLSGVDFRGVQFKGADLRQVLVRRTDLRNADLTDADLSGGVDLTTTLLSNTNLRGADMTDADMSNNDIFNGRLKEANLTRTNLRGTRLDGADLSGALLNETQTDQDTNLRGADLSMTAVVGCLRADLTEADFTDSSLLRAGLVAPGNRVFDSDSDFNCRIQFEGALLPADNDVCGSGFPSDWIATGMTRNGVYVMERLIEKLPRTLECAWLADTDLRAANLAGADLRGALLASTRLDRSDTGRFTNLEGADLRKAVLEGADLDWANLRGADLREAELTGTDLKHADLRGADLRNVVLNDSTQFKLAMYECAGGGGGSCTKFPDYPTFRWRQLQMIGPQSDLEGMDLGGYPGLSSPPVDLTGANVKGAKFVWTDVSGVKFKSCNLENANFSNGIARGADFSGANAKKATFSGANVSGAKFSNANIIEANFVGNGGDPDVSGSLCSEDTSFNSAKVAYVFILKISIEGSFPLYFPVITLEFLPGWNVKGKCCFPVKGGLRIGC